MYLKECVGLSIYPVDGCCWLVSSWLLVGMVGAMIGVDGTIDMVGVGRIAVCGIVGIVEVVVVDGGIVCIVVDGGIVGIVEVVVCGIVGIVGIVVDGGIVGIVEVVVCGVVVVFFGKVIHGCDIWFMVVAYKKSPIGADDSSYLHDHHVYGGTYSTIPGSTTTSI